MGKGTKLDDPVTVEQVPDLDASKREIEEYFQDHKAYEVFDFLLKELMVKQPVDPLAHLLRCLETEYPTGPLKIVVASPPCMGRPALAQRLAETFGLVYIGTGELLERAGVRTENIGLADEQLVVDLVLAKLRQATENIKGWVLDGFPRTRFQASFLKDESIAPDHVLLLQAGEHSIRERMTSVRSGDMEGSYVTPERLTEKLNLFNCHNMAALEVYKDRLFTINAEEGEEAVFLQMAARARMLPKSLGPRPPPRVVLLGPRGVGVREHAKRFAERIGAVLVEGGGIAQDLNSTPGDVLGSAGARLRHEDCQKQGWVLCATAMDANFAAALQQEPGLSPARVVVLHASEDTCVQRLRTILHDPVTGKVWTMLPRNEALRKRLIRKPEVQAPAVIAAHREFTAQIPHVLKAFGNSDRCCLIPADGAPLEVFNAVVDFFERPLPLPAPAGLDI